MPLRPVKCPHCFRKVFVNDDAICPACRANVDERNSGLEDLTPTEFVDGEKLPPICVLCGKASEHYVEIGEKNKAKEMDVTGRIARILGALGGVIAIKIKPDPYVKEYKISVRFPVCNGHKHSTVLTPIDVDYRKYRLTVPVHKDFLKQWKMPQH